MSVESELLDIAMSAAEDAGRLLLERFRAPARGVDTKSTPTDPVSDADRASEQMLLDAIAKHRPDDGVLAEEGGRESSTSGYTWVVDPLDGTVNYLFGIPVWCISIAVKDRDGTAVGVVHDPNHDEFFTAVRGAGAKLNDERIAVNDVDDLSQALIGTGFAYDGEARAEQAARLPRVLPRVRDIRRAGSAAIDLSSLACGRLDGFFEAPMEEWDKAAGLLLIAEAGGTISELPAPKGLSPGVIAAGPRLHDPLRELVLGG
jgi:myo-inositol-1(or 4)-monophosphatase